MFTINIHYYYYIIIMLVKKFKDGKNNRNLRSQDVQFVQGWIDNVIKKWNEYDDQQRIYNLHLVRF